MTSKILGKVFGKMEQKLRDQSQAAKVVGQCPRSSSSASLSSFFARLSQRQVGTRKWKSEQIRGRLD